LKLASTVGASTVVNLYGSEIASVFAQAKAKGVTLVWLHGQSDSGCSISLLQGTHPDLYDAVMALNVTIAYQEVIMAAQGEEAMAALDAAVPDVIVVEGSIPDPGYCEVGGRDIGEILKTTIAKNPKAPIVAVGACATYGGIPAANPNPTNAKGVGAYLNRKDIINIPGCPAHPDWMLLTLATAILGLPIEVDSIGRPKAFFGSLLHDQCPKRGFYDEGLFETEFGTKTDEIKCLYKLGCRGPVTMADCPVRKWNGGTNFCISAGAPCNGCVEPGFPDDMSPLYVAESTLELEVTKKLFATLAGVVLVSAFAYMGMDLAGRVGRKEG